MKLIINPEAQKQIAIYNMEHHKQVPYVLPEDKGPPVKHYNAVAALRRMEMAKRRGLTKRRK